ncbi:MAG: DnaD domain protein [Chloroflexota bacterium]
MNKPFTGFSSDKQKTVRVPEGFFEEVLPQITSMLEMKVTMYLFWRLARSGANASSPRMVSLEELEGEDSLKTTLSQGKGPRTFSDALREGLELAVARGTLLQLRIADKGLRVEGADGVGTQFEYWYLLNTRENKIWVEALGKGQIDVVETPLVQPYMMYASDGAGRASQSALRSRLRVVVERPSVYALYEQNVGLLTPILAERLQDAEGRYPAEWIEAAFEEAVTNNKRNWRYIERILERWAAEGKQSGKDRGPVERSLDPEKYTKGKYAFLFRPDR